MRFTDAGPQDAASLQASLKRVSAWLSRHGVRVDFIVMGGHGHTRLWELVLGGVTRPTLEPMTVPVLMSH